MQRSSFIYLYSSCVVIESSAFSFSSIFLRRNLLTFGRWAVFRYLILCEIRRRLKRNYTSKTVFGRSSARIRLEQFRLCNVPQEEIPPNSSPPPIDVFDVSCHPAWTPSNAIFQMQIIATFVINNTVVFCDTSIAKCIVSLLASNSKYRTQLKRNGRAYDNDTARAV